jgi:hypothetical protein
VPLAIWAMQPMLPVATRSGEVCTIFEITMDVTNFAGFRDGYAASAHYACSEGPLYAERRCSSAFSDHDLLTVDVVRLGQGRHDPLGQGARLVRSDKPYLQDREFVAAELATKSQSRKHLRIAAIPT